MSEEYMPGPGVSIVSFSAPTTVLPNQSFDVVVNWANTGDITVSARLSIVELIDGTRWLKGLNLGDQAPGATGTGTITLLAPTVAGVWGLRVRSGYWDPVTSKLVWTDSRDFNVTVEGPPPPPPPGQIPIPLIVGAVVGIGILGFLLFKK